jgi:hypothetical protein
MPHHPRLLVVILSMIAASAAGPAAASKKLPLPHQLPAQSDFPDILTMFDGSPVATHEDWRQRRRPELRDLFQHYMYGRLPANPQRVAPRELFRDAAALDGAAVMREIELTVGPPDSPKLYLLLVTPKRDQPAPCFLGLNFAGNHTLTPEPRVHLPQTWLPADYPGVVKHRATDAGRNGRANRWPLAEIIRRGYALASMHCGEIQPDRPYALEGFRATLPESTGRGDPTAAGTLMWWAWGLHRAVDYLETDAAIDPQRIAVVGHSRLGKTALLAAAFDERIALAVANQAGCGGSAPSRTDEPRAERIDLLNSVRPQWFCEYFKAFGADPTRLPFDQHALVALCAPRPVLFTAAEDDPGANFAGQFQVLRAATPAYELLGAEGLASEAAAVPAPDSPHIPSPHGYWLRSGQHDMTPADWKIYLDFADKQFPQVEAPQAKAN